MLSNKMNGPSVTMQFISSLMLLVSVCVAQLNPDAPIWTSSVNEALLSTKTFLIEQSASIPYNASTVTLRPHTQEVADNSIAFDILIGNVQVGIGTIEKETSRPSLIHFWPLFPASNQTLSEERIGNLAQSFVKKLSLVGLQKVSISPVNTRGLSTVIFRKFDENILREELEISLQCWDGKVSHFAWRNVKWLPKTIKPSPSRESVLRIVEGELQGKLTNGRKVEGNLSVTRKVAKTRNETDKSIKNSGFTYYWDCWASIRLPNGKRETAQLVWDENNRKVANFLLTPDFSSVTNSAVHMQTQDAIIEDAWPSWSPDEKSIVFTTTRRWNSYPTYAETIVSLGMVNIEQKALTIYRPVPERGWPSGIYSMPTLGDSTNEMLFGFGKSIYQTNLKIGTLNCHANSDRPGLMPAFATKGNQLCFAAFRSIGDQDVFVGKTTDSLRDSNGQWRVANLKGEDLVPVFNKDDSLLAFANKLQENGRVVWSLYLVKPNRIYTQNDLPRKIAGNLPPIGRLSWFPDNKRLLVWSPASPRLLIVDSSDGSYVPLEIPPLVDPDLNKPLRIGEVVLSPTGKKIAFVGHLKVSDHKKVASIYIYDLALNRVQRLTPLDNGDINLFIFPSGNPFAGHPEANANKNNFLSQQKE